MLNRAGFRTDEETIASLVVVRNAIQNRRPGSQDFVKRALFGFHLEETKLKSLLMAGYSRDITKSLIDYFEVAWMAYHYDVINKIEFADFLTRFKKGMHSASSQISPLMFILTISNGQTRSLAALTFIKHLTLAVTSHIFDQDKDALRAMMTCPIKGGFNCLNVNEQDLARMKAQCLIAREAPKKETAQTQSDRPKRSVRFS